MAESELALPGATYWVEGQYISDNDAVGGNGFNNASYRLVTVSPTTFNLTMPGSTIREKTAIQAWKTADAAVETFNEDFCSAPKERFEVARKVTVVDGDTWHYEYVVRNLNSDHAAGAFSVDFPDGTPIANVGFKRHRPPLRRAVRDDRLDVRRRRAERHRPLVHRGLRRQRERQRPALGDDVQLLVRRRRGAGDRGPCRRALQTGPACRRRRRRRGDDLRG